MRPGLLLAAFATSLAGACAPPPADEAQGDAGIVTRSHMSMGTELRLAAWTTDEVRAEAAFAEVFREADRLEALMTTWRETSDVSRINAAAGQRAVAVSAEVRDVLTTARQISEWTEGKFDVTFGSLGELWRFDQGQDNRVPGRDEVLGRVALIAYEDVAIDERAGTVGLRRAGMSINLGGIGKGYTVDRAAALLRARGFEDFLIQFGGDLYAAGRRGPRPWSVGLQDPRGPLDQSFATIDLSNETFSTSGDYENYFFQGGRRYHHILDPDTGEPPEHIRSVTILSARAVLADGLSKGVFLLGPEKGLALLERLPDVEGVIVTARNEVLISSGLRTRLTLRAPPTDAP